MATHDEQQHLVVSYWLPLGTNNLLTLSDKLKQYLHNNQENLRIAGWDGRIQLGDSDLGFTLSINSRYDKHHPIVLTIE